MFFALNVAATPGGTYARPATKSETKGWFSLVGPKAMARHGLRSLAVAIVAIGVAALLYRHQGEAGFAILAILGGAAGWLAGGRVAAVIGAAGVAAVAGSSWSGFLPWPAAVFQAALLTGMTGIAHLTAEWEPVVRRSAAQQRRLDGMTLLLETAHGLAAAADRDAVLNTAVIASARGISRAGDSRPAHAAFHSVVGEELNISVVSDAPLERDMAIGFQYPISRNQAALGAIRTGRPALVRIDHLGGSLRELAEGLGWHVLIMAPVYSGGALQGLLAATARDGVEVDPLQQYMLRALARLTSSGLDAAAQRSAVVADIPAEAPMPALLPTIVSQLRDAVRPIKTQMVDLRPPGTGGYTAGDDMAHAVDKLDDLISVLASRTAIDSSTGVLSRELGLAALERDVLRARRSQARRHCVAVLTVTRSQGADASELIRLVADRLRSGLRREDLIFRYAEDEFVCSFADMDSTDAWPILNRIQAELGSLLGYTPFSVGLTSVGLEQTAG